MPLVRYVRPRLTFLIVLNARVVSLTRTSPPMVSDANRLRWTFGNHVRRVLCFEKGTLFPYCLVFPWNRPSWDRLNGCETTDAENAVRVGNIVGVPREKKTVNRRTDVLRRLGCAAGRRPGSSLGGGQEINFGKCLAHRK